MLLLTLFLCSISRLMCMRPSILWCISSLLAQRLGRRWWSYRWWNQSNATRMMQDGLILFTLVHYKLCFPFEEKNISVWKSISLVHVCSMSSNLIWRLMNKLKSFFAEHKEKVLESLPLFRTSFSRVIESKQQLSRLHLFMCVHESMQSCICFPVRVC